MGTLILAFKEQRQYIIKRLCWSVPIVAVIIATMFIWETRQQLAIGGIGAAVVTMAFLGLVWLPKRK